MNALRIVALAAGTLALASTNASAQLRSNRIPPGQMPPPGLCRVWIDGVAAGRQPRATDCATARMNAPANSRVIYGGQSQGRVSLDQRGATSGRYDPRADPRSPTYDPRFDPNSRVYDPRNGNDTRGTYDPRRDPNATVYDPRYDPNSRVYDPRTRTDGRDRDGIDGSRQGDKEREKWERKREKEFEKAERKRNKHGRDDGDDDDDEHEDGQRGRANDGKHNRGHGRGHG